MTNLRIAAHLLLLATGIAVLLAGIDIAYNRSFQLGLAVGTLSLLVQALNIMWLIATPQKTGACRHKQTTPDGEPWT